MATTAASIKRTLATGQLGQFVRVVRFVGPAVLTALVGWGTVQFTAGRNAERLDKVEKQSGETLTRQEFKTWSDEQREALRMTNQKADQLVTREEFRLFAEQNREQFKDLKDDLRSMRRQ